MNARQQILSDLLTSPSSASAITDHTDIPTAQVTIILQREESAGLVESRQLELLAQFITVWRLTEEGRDIALTFPPAPKLYS